MQLQLTAFLRALTIVALLFPAFGALAQDQPFFNTDKEGLWVHGYDPVSYVVDGKAQKGSAEHVVAYRNAKFRFVSKEHKELFKANPEKYLPAYGGYCAYGVSDNHKVDVDPETFTSHDGKVFLFYNKYLTNTLKDWNEDRTGNYKKAEANWKKFKHSTM